MRGCKTVPWPYFLACSCPRTNVEIVSWMAYKIAHGIESVTFSIRFATVTRAPLRRQRLAATAVHDKSFLAIYQMHHVGAKSTFRLK